MKLLSGERPSLRNWFGFWVVGFVSISLLGTALSGALWLIGQGAKALGPPYPAIVEFSLPTALRIVPLAAGGFGILLATNMMFTFRRMERTRLERELRIPGHHPIIGDFEHSPYNKSWGAQPVLPSGQSVRLWGKGSEPSAAESSLWSGFLARTDELLLLATTDLLRQNHPYQSCASVTFTPSTITLREDGTMEVLFDFSTVPEDFVPTDFSDHHEEVCPSAVFTSSLELEYTYW